MDADAYHQVTWVTPDGAKKQMEKADYSIGGPVYLSNDKAHKVQLQEAAARAHQQHAEGRRGEDR